MYAQGELSLEMSGPVWFISVGKIDGIDTPWFICRTNMLSLPCQLRREPRKQASCTGRCVSFVSISTTELAFARQ